MSLFRFLEKISCEGFRFQLHYVGPPPTIDVHIDALYERWAVSFDRDGFVCYTRFSEEETNVEDQDPLNGLFDRSRRSWEEAAEDLGILFIGSYSFRAAGNEYIATGLLPDFGSEHGTLITSQKDSEEARALAEHTEYHTSGLNAYFYDRYDRERFIDTLNDWGWFGKGEPPEWFRGAVHR